MNIKKMTVAIVVTVCIDIFVVFGSYLFITSHTPKVPVIANAPDNLFGWKFPIAKFPLTGSTSNQIAYSSVRDPGGIPQGLPVRLKIPGIGVDSAIEDAHITPDGRMDVPAGSVNVAWFALGPHPGQIGSAVIGGHYGIENGVPFVFYNLDKVKVGDKVYIVDDKNVTLAFQVKAIKSFDRNGDSTTVFTSQDSIAHLNLITCEGIWNQVKGAYPQRLVVFTDAIPAEGAIVVPKKEAAVATQSTVIGTSTPVSSGVNFLSFLQQLMISILSVYASPVDALITSILLLGIVFIVFKFIRRRR